MRSGRKPDHVGHAHLESALSPSRSRRRPIRSHPWRGTRPGTSKPACGLNLLVAAIILWNTRYLQAAFDALRARGTVIPPELVRHVAPLGWEHISLTGDYVWAAEAQPAAGAPRPLRDRPSLLAA